MKALGRLLLADHQPVPAKHLFETAAASDPTDAEARALLAGAKRVVDKQPLNLFHVGLIALALPHARIVHCVRDPRDVLTSIYFQDFAASQTYATDLVDLAHFARETTRLMVYWKALLPGRIYTCEYEELTRRPESEAKALLDAVDLEWRDEVLRFHEQRAMVRTPSRWRCAVARGRPLDYVACLRVA